jgi:hypothetical protein
MTDISLILPMAALEQISKWADASGLPRAKFYSTALILGARIMTSSVGSGLVDALIRSSRAKQIPGRWAATPASPRIERKG